MSGYARIEVLGNGVRLRFEQVDPSGFSGKFDKLRDDFYRAVPTAKWNNSIRWMMVPNQDLGKVLDFCYARFGTDKVKVTYVNNNKSQPLQLSMRL